MGPGGAPKLLVLHIDEKYDDDNDDGNNDDYAANVDSEQPSWRRVKKLR